MVTAAAARAVTPEHKVRQRLYSAAAQVFAQKGYAATTVREIVQKAGVTKPVLYYYFGNKEGIYKAVVESAVRDFEARLGGIEKLKGSASMRLGRLCEEIYALSIEHLDVVRLMHSIYYGPPQGAPFFDFDKVLFRVHDSVLKMIRQGARAGEFHGDPQIMALAVLGACNECVDLQLVHPEQAVDQAGFVKVLRVVLNGMKGRSGR